MDHPAASSVSAGPAHPSFRQALGYWLKLGFISFGGPAGQIAIMHRELVERRRWISDEHFLHALNFCMFLPGPEAQQLATWLGWRLHGTRGAVAAGALFVLPAVFILYALSWIYMAGANVPWLRALFQGLLPAVIAVVAAAVLRIGRTALRSHALGMLALLSFAAIFYFKISFIVIIAAAALIGWIGHRAAPSQFPAGRHQRPIHADESVASLALPPPPPPTAYRALRIGAVCLLLWWLPVVLLGVWLGWHSTPAQQGLFFSKAALVTFGGAYAVLPYVAQQAVDHYGWLSHPQMMSGLALAETTPGPLIMVLQFVGFAGGWQNPGTLSPWLAATVGALITTWTTFLPCFLFVLLGAPHVERLRDQPRLNAALMAITAAVLGVILNLAVQFSIHACWPHRTSTGWGSFDWFVAVTAVAAFVALWRWKAGLVPVIAICALLGLLKQLVLG